MLAVRIALLFFLVPYVSPVVEAQSSAVAASKSGTGATTPKPAMLRYPDVGMPHIVFVHADDLCIVPSAGGAPERVTYHPAGETLCDRPPIGSGKSELG